ncbi:hypothetical protein ACQ10R_14845, partial [Enterococcus faecalis]
VAAWDGRETLDRLLSRADHALYRAKAAGRNVVLIDDGHWSGLTIETDVGLAPTSDVVAFEPHARRGTRPRRKAPDPQT